MYDIVNIVPYVMKYKRHPVSGQPLQLKDLIKLNFYKNADGEYNCPVTNKVFTEHTHIVAVKPTGNVYAYEAVSWHGHGCRNGVHAWCLHPTS